MAPGQKGTEKNFHKKLWIRSGITCSVPTSKTRSISQFWVENQLFLRETFAFLLGYDIGLLEMNFAFLLDFDIRNELRFFIGL